MNILQKIADAVRGTSNQDAASRAKALSRLGPPRQRYDAGIPA